MNLYDTIDKACAGKTEGCTVKLAELVTDIDWDRVAFVRMQAWAKDPGTGIGVEGLEMDEFEDLIVFAKDRVPVRVIKRDYDPGTPYNRTIFLDFGAEKVHWLVFPKQKANFKAIRVSDGELQNFDLVPVQE